MSTREEREQRVAEVRAERAEKVANATGTTTTTKTGGTTASGNTTQPSANMTPTQIKAWEKNPTKQKQASSYVSRVGSADSSAYAQAAKDRTEKQRRTLTPTTIRAIDNSYSDSTKQYYYGKSKYTTDSTDADQQAYVRGINMWGDTGTWYEQAGQSKSRAEKRAEELKTQLTNARKMGTYGVWDNGVYMGEVNNNDSKSTRLLELQYKQAQEEATKAAKEYEYAQSFYNYDQQVKQNEEDKQTLANAQARGLTAEDWYNEAQSRKDTTWQNVQDIETKLNIAKDYAERAKAMSGNPDFAPSLLEYYNNMASRLQTRYDNALDRYNKASALLESATRTRYADIRSNRDYLTKSAEGGKYYHSVIKPADKESVEQASKIGTTTSDQYIQGVTMLAGDKSYLRPADNWSADERGIYFYLVDPDDMTRADEYARQTNAKYANAEKYEKLQKIEDWSAKNFGTGAVASVASVGAFLVGGVDMAGDLAEYSARGEITAKPFVSATEFSNAVTGAVSSALNQKYGTVEFLGEQRGLGDMYQVATSVAQSMASIALGGEAGSLAVFFGTSGAMGIDEALERGATPTQAIAYGVLKGGIEVLTEKFSVENLLTNVNIKSSLQSILMQAGIEASEESMSTLLGTVADAAVMGDKSELHVARYYYLSQGYSMEEANKKASTEWLNGLAWDAISGALSGGMSAGLSLAGQAVKYNTVGEGAQQRARNKAETTANVNALVPAITARLNELGQTQNVNATAQTIANKALGTRSYDNSLILSNKTAQQVYNELTNAHKGTQDTAWAKQAIANRTAELTREAEESRAKLEEAERAETAASEQNTAQAQRPAQPFTANYKGQTGDITALVKDSHNNYAARVQLPNGKVVEVSEQNLTFDENTQELLEAARPYDFGDAVVTEYLKGGADVSPQLFVAAFSYANMFGSSTKLTADAAYNYSRNNGEGSAAKVLTRAQFTTAFELGRKQAESRTVNTATAKRGKGEVHFGKYINHGGIKYTGATENMVKPADLAVLKTMAKVTGVDIYFYETAVDGSGKYQGANGFYRNGSIYLDVHAMAERSSEESAVLLAAAHEMTHYLRQNNEQGYTQLRDFVVEHLMEDGVDIEELAHEKKAREKNNTDFTMDDAMEEVIADSCELMLEDTRLPDIMARENPSLLEQIRDWLKDFTQKLRTAFMGVEAKHTEAKAMLKYADELQQLWDNAMAEAVRNGESARESEGGNGRNSFRGYDEETGRGIYESNFPKGTPRKAKGERILNYIQNVWSKKPIDLVINNPDGTTRKIKAQFDPTFDEVNGEPTDASKLMGGNRHGTASEQRVTLDLADDYYDIAADSTYNYSKDETGKDKVTHENVNQWHYFINDILFQEYGEKETTPYRVTINVKERSDGQFVYSFNAERQKESPSTRQTLHADVTHNVSDMSNARTSVDNVSHPTTEVKSKYSLRDNLKDDLEKVKKRQFDFQNSEVLIGDTSDFLVNEIGFKPLPFYMPATKAYRAIVSEAQAIKDGQPTGGNIHYHGLGVNTVYNILAKAETPLAAYVSTEEIDNKRDNRIVIVTDVKANGGLGVVVVAPNTMARNDGSQVSANKTITLFDRQSVVNAVQNAYDQGRLLYIDKKSGQRFDSGRQGTNRPTTISEVVRENNIQRFWENVKWRELNNSGTLTAGDVTNSTMAEAFKRATEVKSKYSMRDVATNDTAQQRKEREQSYADLKRQNEILKRRVEHWKAQTKQTQQATVRKADTDKLANRIAKSMGLTSREAVRQVKNMLEDMGNTIVQSTGEELNYIDFKGMAQDIADYALNNIEVELESEHAEMYQQLRSYIKGTTLRISENELSNLDEDWRKRHFGTFSISTKKGLPVDTAYMELSEMFGEGVFPTDVYSQAEMLELMDEHLYAWKPKYGNPYEYYMNEAREYYAQEIIDAMFNSNEIRQTAPTYADKATAALEAAEAKSERLQKRMNERIKQIEQEGKERLKKAVQDERAYQLQRQERAQKVKNINKISDSLMRKLTENSGKNHIPDYLKEPVAQLLKAIDTRTTYTGAKGMLEFTGKMDKLAGVIANYGRRSVDNDTLGDDMFIDFPPDIAEQMREFSQRIRDAAETRREWKLADLSLQELYELEEMMQTVSHAITEANALYTQDNTVSELSHETVEYLDSMKATGRAANKFLVWDNLTPVYFFKRLGEGGEKIFKSLTKGWSDLAFKLQEIKEFTETLYQAQEAIDAGNTVIEVQLHNKLDTGLTNVDTVSVKLSKAQIMSIYGLTLRGKQAIRHMNSGGITLRDIERRGQQKIVQNDDYLLSALDIEKLINDNLTARDKEIVRAMVKFMSITGSKWGNVVTQARWGIDKFTEENYFPISTDKRSRDVRNNDSAGSTTGLYRIVNMGFTKELTPDASNPIVIDNVFDVFANHMADMAKYSSLALPILDMMKFINYRAVTATAADGTQYTTESVRKAMDIAYGTDAQDYLVRFMRDLNSSNEGGITGGIEKLVGHYKRAAVGANLRVALLQPTSIARAAMVISPKYIAKGMANVGQLRQSYSEAMMNSGAAMWKSQGFYDVNVNRSMRSQIKHDETTVDKVVDMSMWLAEKGDQLTWSQLWTAAKAEQIDKARQAGETLTDEQLAQRTTDRFEEIIYQTQVMDSTLTRSQLMRSKDGLAKSFTAFMAEPTLSYNTLLNMYSEFRNESRQTSRQAAWRKMGNKIMSGFAVHVVSQALSAVVESVADAWRDDDEYMTFMEKWMDKFFGEYFFDGNLAGDLSVVQKLPIAKDFLAALQGEDSTRMEMEGAASVYNFVKTSVSKFKTLLENGEDVGKVTGWGWIEQGLKAVSQLSGIPGYNLTREVVAMWNNTIGAFTGEKIKSYKTNPESEIKTAFINGYLTEEEAHALLMDADVMGDKVYFTDHAAETKIADWTNDGTAEMYDALYEAMEYGDKRAFEIAMQSLTEDGSRYRYDVIQNVRSKIKEWYTGDERGASKLNKEMAEQMLIEYGGLTKHDAHTTIQQQTCAKVEGFSYNEKKNLYLNGDLSREDAIRIIMTYGKDDNSQLLVEYTDQDKAREYAEKQVQQWQMALDTQIDYDDIRSAYDAGEITDTELVQDLIVYGGMEEEAAENKAYLWKWKGGDENLNSVTGAQARRYDAYIAGAGIDMSKTQYANYIDGHLASTFKGDLKEGSTTSYIPNSKRNKIWAYIDTLPLTPEEKDAMAIVYAYDGDADRSASSTYFDLQEAPWNS